MINVYIQLYFKLLESEQLKEEEREKTLFHVEN